MVGFGVAVWLGWQRGAVPRRGGVLGTLHPASKQRSEGEKVRVGDDIILVSVSSERYLVSVRGRECAREGGSVRRGGCGRCECATGRLSVRTECATGRLWAL